MIQYGKTLLIKYLVFTIMLSFFSCSQGNTKTKENRKSTSHKVLPKGFCAVGLVYHRFGDERYPSTNTSIKIFEEQLKYLVKNGFRTYTVSDLVNNAHDTLKKVFITVDDGFKSFYNNGWPLLKKYNCKATLFINTESVGWSDYLSWEQLKELAEAGIEIGSHSHKHSYFLNKPDSLLEEEFKKDLDISEKLFKNGLGFVPKVYAYPYGEYNKKMAYILKQRGYILSFAQNSGVWSSKSHLYAIPRFPIAGNYVKMDQFKLKVEMKPLFLEGDTFFPIELKSAQELSLQLMLNSSIGEHSLNCFYNNKLNNEILTFKNDTINIEASMPGRQRRVLLTFTAKNSKDEWCWWSKLLINKEIEE